MKAIEYYLQDTFNQLLDRALEEKKNAQNSNNEFDKGVLVGYYSVILKLMNQAQAFGIRDKLPPKWRNFNPEELLSSLS